MALRAMPLVLALALAAMLGGCSYDYKQRTDRVSYSAGDAVRANMAIQTTNPSRASSYSTRGLGRDGKLVETEGGATTPTP